MGSRFPAGPPSTRAGPAQDGAHALTHPIRTVSPAWGVDHLDRALGVRRGVAQRHDPLAGGPVPVQHGQAQDEVYAAALATWCE